MRSVPVTLTQLIVKFVPLFSQRVWEHARFCRKVYSAFQLSEKTIGLSGSKNRPPQRYEKLFSSSFKCKPL